MHTKILRGFLYRLQKKKNSKRTFGGSMKETIPNHKQENVLGWNETWKWVYEKDFVKIGKIPPRLLVCTWRATISIFIIIIF